MEKKNPKEIYLLIDSNSLIHRAFHALPSLTTPDGSPIGAIYGLASILIKVIREKAPKYIAAAFDRPEPTFRKIEYGEYKATRKPTSDELVPQIKEAYKLFNAFGIKTFDASGWEADDIIATIAHKISREKDRVAVILSGDLDALQVVKGDNIIVEVPQKGISNTVIYNESAVKERFGVSPLQFPDYKGLVGDKSDNIPGVPGIGPKTACKLIQDYGSIEKMYIEAKEVGLSDEKLRLRLIENEDLAMVSKKLAKLSFNVPLNVILEELEVRDIDSNSNLIEYLDNLGFNSLINRIENNKVSRYNTD